MLSRAQSLGIVREVSSLQQHLDHLTSVRDFPLFDGDFLPDKLPTIIERASGGAAGKGKGKSQGKPYETPALKPPKLKAAGRQQSLMIARQVRAEVSSAKWSFLVASLKDALIPMAPPREPATQHELVGERPLSLFGRRALLTNRLTRVRSTRGCDSSRCALNYNHRALNYNQVDSRMRFLEMCVARHWQWDELRRAHWSTMMLLASLGGAPKPAPGRRK